MSYLVWNLNHQAVIGLCIATAFFRSDWTNDTSFEEIISFYFDKEIEDFRSLGELVDALESDLRPNFHPIFRRVSDINFPQAASFC